MPSCGVNCRKNTGSKNPQVAKTRKKEEERFYQNVQHANSKKSKIIKEQEASGLLCR